MIRRARFVLVLVPPLSGLMLATPSARAAQPITLAGGRIRLGGSVSGTLAPRDRGFFNYTDYRRNALRRLRIELGIEAQLDERVALVGELRTDDLERPRAHAAYLRLKPWPRRALDLQAGRIPPVFGAFSRRAYGVDNPLPGLPLPYQYLTSLRADAVPPDAGHLAARRGFGWQVRYPIGSSSAAPGLPLVSAERWDVGIQARVGGDPVTVSAAITQGTLSRPRIGDDNDGKQLSARLAIRLSPGLVVGTSGARGQYLAREAEDALPAATVERNYRQHALGIDVDYSRGYWILRGEAVWSRWDLPVIAAPPLERGLDARGVTVEARYKVMAGLQLAVRADHLGFERIAIGDGLATWDAPVSRLEVGGGYSLRRDLMLKASYQWNRRDGGPRRSQGMPSAQLVFWF